MPSTEGEYVLFDAGVFIGALLAGDPRHGEARPLGEAARRGNLLACTTTGIPSESDKSRFLIAALHKLWLIPTFCAKPQADVRNLIGRRTNGGPHII